jgi:hypothetical protein
MAGIAAPGNPTHATKKGPGRLPSVEMPLTFISPFELMNAATYFANHQEIALLIESPGTYTR